MNWHGDSDGCQLQDHHRRGQYGYGCNCAAPRFQHFLERFDLQREDITDASLSLDHARCTRIDLQFARQPQDLDINAPITNIFVNSCGLKQILPRERPLRRFEEGNNAYAPLLSENGVVSGSTSLRPRGSSCQPSNL